jgi:hypothetical protein
LVDEGFLVGVLEEDDDFDLDEDLEEDFDEDDVDDDSDNVAVGVDEVEFEGMVVDDEKITEEEDSTGGAQGSVDSKFFAT